MDNHPWPSVGDLVALRESGAVGRVTHIFEVYPFAGELVVMVSGERRIVKCSDIEVLEGSAKKEAG